MNDARNAARGIVELTCERPWLVARFPRPQRMVSWSLNRPGFVEADSVAFREVRDADLPADRDPVAWFRQVLAERGIGEAVGMMTARDVSSFVRRAVEIGDVQAECIVTLGLNNGERIGRRVGGAAVVGAGTINILCHASLPLSDAALLEAASLVAQARTVALVDAGYRRPGRSDIVTGTGTDCIVMASPMGERPNAYAGMHTAIGEAIGACVLDATRTAWLAWQRERTS